MPRRTLGGIWPQGTSWAWRGASTSGWQCSVCEALRELCADLLDPISERGKWQPTLVLLPGKFYGQRSLVGYSPWHRKDLDTTEGLHFTSSICEGTGSDAWVRTLDQHSGAQPLTSLGLSLLICRMEMVRRPANLLGFLQKLKSMICVTGSARARHGASDGGLVSSKSPFSCGPSGATFLGREPSLRSGVQEARASASAPRSHQSGHTRGSQVRPHPPARLSALRAPLGLAFLPRRALPRLVLQGPRLWNVLTQPPSEPEGVLGVAPNPQLPTRTWPVWEIRQRPGLA